MALEAGPAATGFSAAVLAAGLDSFFKQLTAENLEALLRQELGHPRRLDDFFPGDHERPAIAAALALRPAIAGAHRAGQHPQSRLMDMVLGLLARSAQFVKCASGGSLPAAPVRPFALRGRPQAGRVPGSRRMEGRHRKPGSGPVCRSRLRGRHGQRRNAGGHPARGSRRRRASSGYGTRVSFGYVTREALDRRRGKRGATGGGGRDGVEPARLPFAACHLCRGERRSRSGGSLRRRCWPDELEALEKTHPRGAVERGEGGRHRRAALFYEVRAAHSPDTKMWASPESTAWTVVLENDPRFQISCLNRFIYVKTVADLTQALQGAEPVREKFPPWAWPATAAQRPSWRAHFARWGARGFVPLGRMQNPPLGWRHDGRPPLGDLVTWSDWEK